MKKLLSISLIVVFSFATFAFTASNTSNIVEPVKPEKTEITLNEEALYCKVTVNGNTATCWFCDCAELAAQLS